MGTLQDVRYGMRMLAKTPGVTGMALLTLALGIGGNTALFSIVNGVILRQLPYRDPARLVRVHGNNLQEGAGNFPVSPLDVADFRKQNRSFENLAAFTNSTVVLTGLDEPRAVRVTTTSAGLVDILGTGMQMGRFFTPDEEKEGAERVIVLSHDFWQTQLGGDPVVLGKVLTLGGIPRRVVGVLPAGFRSPIPGPAGESEIWRPLILPSDPGERGGHYTFCIARLKEGVTPQQAESDLNNLAQAIEHTYPATSTGWRTHVVPLQDDLVGELRRGLLALSGAVGLVLLIACANVAGLLMGKSAAREREMAIRRALGAGSWRISRQLLTECVLLSVAGGGLGILIATWAKEMILALAGSTIPAWARIGLDGRVLAFTLVVSLATGILCGIGPAFGGARGDLGIALKEGGSQSGTGKGRARFRRLLVASQVALSVVLLAGAILLLQSLRHLLRVDTGFERENVVTLSLSLPPARYTDAARINGFYRRLLERVESTPQLKSTGLVNILPLSGGYSDDSFTVDEHPAVAPGKEPTAEHRAISEGYFPALGVPLREGRFFTAADDARSLPVALINEAMARTFFRGENPLGKHLKYNEASREIVGIVGDIRHFGLAEAPRPEYYFPFAQESLTEYTLVARGTGDSVQLVPALRSAVWSLDRDLAVANVRTLQDLAVRSVAQPRFRALLLGAFAALALLLAAVGIYGVLATAVTQRTREIGLRMALGASRRDVVAMVVGQGMRLVAVGLGAGLLGALALARLLSGLLFEVSPTDPLALAAVSALLAGVALGACSLPAWRAAQVEPMTALRVE